MISLIMTKNKLRAFEFEPYLSRTTKNQHFYTIWGFVYRFRGYFVSFQSCYYEGKPYPVGDFVPQENCTMLCFCHGYGPPSPCVPMCQRLPVPTCEIGKELYSYDDEEDQYGCRCKMTVCRDEDWKVGIKTVPQGKSDFFFDKNLNLVDECSDIRENSTKGLFFRDACGKWRLGTLSKPWRQWQRRKIKGLMSKTMALHVRYCSLYIS